MKVKVFQSNHNGKIEFTRAELEKLLNEVYTDGYNEGKSSHWTWTSPYVSSHDGLNLTNAISCTASKIDSPAVSTNYAADKITAVLDNSTATADASIGTTNATDRTVGANPTYTVKVNGTDISKLVNDIFGAGASRNTPKKVEDAFDKLAKELSF